MQRLELIEVMEDEAPRVVTGKVTVVDDEEGTATVMDANGDTREGLPWINHVVVDDDVYILEQGNVEVILGTTGEGLVSSNDSVLVGVIQEPAPEAHEFTWAQVTASPGTFNPGGYLIIDHVPVDGMIPDTVPGFTTSTDAQRVVAVGDWLVAVDTDRDGTTDSYHRVRHDVRTAGLPSTTGHQPGDVLTLVDPVAGNMIWESGRPKVTVSATAGETPFSVALRPHAVSDWTFDDPSGGPLSGPGQAQLITDALLVSVSDLAGADMTAELDAIQPGERVEINDTGVNTVVITVDAVTTTGTGPDVVYRLDYTTSTGTITASYPFNGMVSVFRPLAGDLNDEFINTADRRHWIHDDTDWVEITSLPPAQPNTVLTADAQGSLMWAPQRDMTPIGTVIMFPSWNSPPGYLLCDGRAIPNDAAHTAVRAMLGTHTPDLRGQFIRGAHSGHNPLVREHWTTARPHTLPHRHEGRPLPRHQRDDLGG